MRDSSSTPRLDAFRQSARSLLRFWPLVLVLLVPLTCLAVASLSAWYVPFYLLLVGLLVLAPDRSQRAGAQAHATALAGSHLTELAAGGLASNDNEASDTAEPAESVIEAAAQGTVTKSRRGRTRARAKPKFVPDPSHATWIRVGPGKFVRVETPPEGELDPEAPATQGDPSVDETIGLGALTEPVNAAPPILPEPPPGDRGDPLPNAEPDPVLQWEPPETSPLPLEALEPATLLEQHALSTEPRAESSEATEPAPQDGPVEQQLYELEPTPTETTSATEQTTRPWTSSHDLSFEGISTFVPRSWSALDQAGDDDGLRMGDQPSEEWVETERRIEEEPQATVEAAGPTRSDLGGLADLADTVANDPIDLAMHTEDLPHQGGSETAVEPDSLALEASPALVADPEEAEPATVLGRGSWPGAVAAPPSPGRFVARRPLRQLDIRGWVPERLASQARDDSLFSLARGPPLARAFHGLCAARQQASVVIHGRGRAPARPDFFGREGELPGNRLVRIKTRASHSAFLRDSA